MRNLHLFLRSSYAFFIQRSSRIYGGGEGRKVMVVTAAAAARQQLELR